MKTTARIYLTNFLGTLIRVFDAIVRSDLKKPLPNFALASIFILSFILISVSSEAQLPHNKFKSLMRVDVAEFFNLINENSIDDVRISDMTRPADSMYTKFSKSSPSAFSTSINHPMDLATIEAAPLNFTEEGAAAAMMLIAKSHVYRRRYSDHRELCDQIIANFVNSEEVVGFTKQSVSTRA